MNRIVLIGNGFDLAHGLQTSYADFINWYWEQKINELKVNTSYVSEDSLCTFRTRNSQLICNELAWSFPYLLNTISSKEIVKSIMNGSTQIEVELSSFIERINDSVETKGWVDIENEYYSLLTDYAIKHYSEENIENLNKQLDCLQKKLIEYLRSVYPREINVKLIKAIRLKIYAPIEFSEVSIEATKVLREHIDMWKKLSKPDWIQKLYSCGISNHLHSEYIRTMENFIKNPEFQSTSPLLFMLPDRIMLLSFNYTKTAQDYMDDRDNVSINYIHGEVDKPDSIIFGYGDELDDNYKQLQKQNNSECLRNVKSIKYLESNNYRNILEFAESAPYQVCIMGHSCGNSDRTLLNTLFEHKNCISIKPYYYLKNDGTDNYLELVQNISRNFTDMKLMRDRVVNKTYCETLT